MRKILVVFTTLLFLNILQAQPEPDTSCFDAGIFCIEEQFDGNIYTLPEWLPGGDPEFPIKLCSSGGNPNNIMYFSFVPNSSTVTIQLNAFGCTEGNSSGSLGIQWGVYESCDEIYEDNPYSLICESDVDVGIVGLSTASASNFIPGHTYVLFVDGHGGSVCNFTVDFLTGMSDSSSPYVVEEPTHFTTSNGDSIIFGDTLEYCMNGYFTTTVHGSTNNAGYIWSSPHDDGITETIHASDADTLAFTFTEKDSLYKVCAIATTDCDDSEQHCFYVNIIEIPEDSLGVFEYCMSEITTDGVSPTLWEGPIIKARGKHYYTVKDTVLGCTHLQSITIVGINDAIATLDTIICSLDTLFYNGDTITTDTFDKDYFFEGQSAEGCDSLLHFKMDRYNLEGELSELVCLDNNQFGLEVTIDNFLPSDADSITVLWLKDDVPLVSTINGIYEIEVAQKGIYSVMVSVFKDGKSCMFDLNEVNIDRFITAGFTTSQNDICVTDSITVTLDEFNIGASYHWMSGDQINEVFPGVYTIQWDKPGTYNLMLEVDYQSCKVSSGLIEIEVEAELDSPNLNCMGTSNDSIAVEWNNIDCSSLYEVWFDGTLITTDAIDQYSFTDLEEGQSYQIIVNALSDCLCPMSSDTINCVTENCPDDIELFLNHSPIKLCQDAFTTDTLLTGYNSGSSGGSFSWQGSIISQEGLIQSGLDAGSYPLILTYELENCFFEIADTFTIYPSLDFESSYFDISCYYNNDGEINITPSQGSAPFYLYLNGTIQDDMDVTGLAEGNYSILVNDVNLCSSSETIEIFRPEEPQIFIDGITIIERGQTYDYELSIGNTSYDSVVWSVPALDTILCSGLCEEITYAPISDQQLCIELFFDGECSKDTCIDLRVSRDVNIFMPNVFTPGIRDGLNDYFMVKTNAYEALKVINFSIFDRWGGLLFFKNSGTISSQTDESFGWDGTVNGQDAMTGVYVYYIELLDSKGETHQFYGDVTLLR